MASHAAAWLIQELLAAPLRFSLCLFHATLGDRIRYLSMAAVPWLKYLALSALG